ncbi:MAG: WecB/TagA/CpsF family glycosyltransferase [Candidatus Beckwithbacteria bacterium]|nr:WecB/TagA/CpsF family glycosyltransferase [Patescibacteria group bacterium]
MGLKIDCIPMERVLRKVEGWIRGSWKRYIVTPNPEMVMEVQSDAKFKDILNKADLRIPDGVGLVWALNRKFRSGAECERVAGAEVMKELCKLASKKKWRVYLLGGQKLVAKKAAEKLRNKYDGLEIKGLMGLENVGRASKQENDEVIAEINKYQPDLLFVGFGHNKQERWIAENLAKLKVKVAMGVGGSFDYVIKPWLKAPKVVQKMGLEWLWRLIMQPWRLKRQLKLVRFVFLVLKSLKTDRI